jgi:ElaB/YqjD/DUF883 family membrane-anchored ribosome-binding protein
MSNQAGNPKEIESEIERTRSRMDATLHEIEDRLSPGGLLDEGYYYFRRSGTNDFINNLGATARDNPIPVTMTALGVGWLMMSSPGNGVEHSRSDSASATDKTRHAARKAEDKAGDVAERARTRLEQMKSGTDSATDRIVDRSRQAKNRFNTMLNEQPLVMGALGIALGAILGVGMPPTETEDELVGDMRNDAVGQAVEAGQQQAEKVKSTAESAKREADKGGLTPGNDSRPRPG